MATIHRPVQINASKNRRRRASIGAVPERSESSASPVTTKTKIRRTRSGGLKRTLKRGEKSSGKNMLLGMIDKQMLRPWQDEVKFLPETDAPTMSAAPSIMVSAEDIFYAQMNGESIDPSMMRSKQSIVSDVSDDDEVDDDIDDVIDDAGFSADACSPFAGPDNASAGLEEDACEKSSLQSGNSRRCSVWVSSDRSIKSSRA